MAGVRRRRLAAAVIGVCALGAGTAGTIAVAGGTPANKVVAAGSKTQVIAPGSNVTILSGIMRTSKPKDVIMQVALECSILTQLKTSNDSPTSRAEGRVRAWVEVDDRIVPIQDDSNPPQDPAQNGNGNDSDKVVFCDRTYQRKVTDNEDPLDGQDTEEDFIDTKSSHAFNWVRLNMGSGVHKIEVVADLEADASNPGAAAEAIIGNRTLIAEPGKFGNDATIAEVGDSSSGK